MARLVFPRCRFECAGHLQRLGWVWCLEKFNPPAPNHMLKPTMCLVGCTHLLRCCLFSCWWNTCFSQFISRFWEMVGCLDGGLPCFAAGGVTCLPCSVQKWRSKHPNWFHMLLKVPKGLSARIWICHVPRFYCVYCWWLEVVLSIWSYPTASASKSWLVSLLSGVLNMIHYRYTCKYKIYLFMRCVFLHMCIYI